MGMLLRRYTCKAVHSTGIFSCPLKKLPEVIAWTPHTKNMTQDRLLWYNKRRRVAAMWKYYITTAHDSTRSPTR